VANSIRQQITDAFVAALEGITIANGYQTAVKLVSESMQNYEQIPKSDLPALFPIDTDEQREWVELAESSVVDLEGHLDLLVTAVVFDRNDHTRQARNDLMRDIEKAVLNDSTLDALILWLAPMGVVTDQGTIPNYSIWDQSYRIHYRYNSANGG
jgi:hypothetical protein